MAQTWCRTPGQAAAQQAGDPGRTQTNSQNQAVNLANLENRPFDNRDEFPQLANHRQRLKAGKSDLISRHMKPAHKSMSRMLGYCLASGTEEAWAEFRFVAQARLDEVEAAQLAYFTLSSLEPQNVQKIAALAFRAVGNPLPAFLGGMEDARTWAAWASRHELKAYALASFEAMPPCDQAAFFKHISSVEIAA